MEQSLRYAIAKIKRDLSAKKYSRMETIENAIYQYYIREDEIDALFRSINSWLEKGTNWIYGRPYTKVEIVLLKCYVYGHKGGD